MRRFYRRTSSPRRNLAKYTWVRDHIHNAGPANPNTNDLLANWKSQSGMVFNVIDYSIWRIHIRISIDIHLTANAYTSQDAYTYGIYVDSKNQTQFATGPLTNQYEQRYLAWNNIYLSKSLYDGSPFASTVNLNTYALYEEVDVRSRAKMNPENDTLYCQLTSLGNAQADAFDLTYSILLRHR